MFFYADLSAVPSGARMERRSVYRGEPMKESMTLDEAADVIIAEVWGENIPKHQARMVVMGALGKYALGELEKTEQTIKEAFAEGKEA